MVINYFSRLNEVSFVVNHPDNIDNSIGTFSKRDQKLIRAVLNDLQESFEK